MTRLPSTPPSCSTRTWRACAAAPHRWRRAAAATPPPPPRRAWRACCRPAGSRATSPTANALAQPPRPRVRLQPARPERLHLGAHGHHLAADQRLEHRPRACQHRRQHGRLGCRRGAACMFGSAATAAVATASHRRAEAGAWPGGGLASIRLAGAVLPLPAPLSSGCREPAPRRAAQAYSKAWRVASGGRGLRSGLGDGGVGGGSHVGGDSSTSSPRRPPARPPPAAASRRVRPQPRAAIVSFALTGQPWHHIMMAWYEIDRIDFGGHSCSPK